MTVNKSTITIVYTQNNSIWKTAFWTHGIGKFSEQFNFYTSTQNKKEKKNYETKYFVHISIDSHLQAKACHNQQAEYLTNSICYFFFFILLSLCNLSW